MKLEACYFKKKKKSKKQGPEKETLPVTGQTTLPGMTGNQHVATSQLLKLSSAVLITKDYYSNFKKLM